MKFTAIIVTYNNTAVIAGTLAAICRHPHMAKCIVADNASTDDTVAIIGGRFPQVRILQNPMNMGFGAACNRALMQVKTEVALILSPDAAIDETSIGALLDAFAATPKLALAGTAIDAQEAAIVTPPAMPIPQLHTLPTAPGFEGFQPLRSGAIALWRVCHMRQAGFFDPAFFLDHGNDDIVGRTHRAGYDALLIDGAYVRQLPVARSPFLTRLKSRAREKDADPTLPLVEYWETLFVDLDTRYKNTMAMLAEELDATMQRFREKEADALAAHKARIEAGLVEFRKIPETRPDEQAKMEIVLQAYQDDWQQTVARHEQDVNRALVQHGEKCAAVNHTHEARWRALGQRQDAYMKAFASAGRSLTAAGHYVIFAVDPDAERDIADIVTIAIITYKRPALLRRALQALQKIVVPPNAAVKLLVIDNDKEESARQVVHESAQHMPFPVEYVVEEKRGIPHARNKALDVAATSDYIAFADDDDIADRQWIAALLEAARTYHADVVKGQVEYTFADGKKHLAVLGIFESVLLPTGSPLGWAATNNVLFSTSIYKKTGLRFDTDFMKTGGSDTHFFRCAARLGASIVFVREAIIYSPVSGERAGWRWIIRRHTRFGATITMSDIKYGGYLYAVRQVARELVGSGVYGYRILRRVLAGHHTPMHPLMIACFAIGRVMGLLHLSPQEYK